MVAIGNAPTALFHLLERLREWPERPAALLAFPVGFVGAAESKEALIAADARSALGHPARAPWRERPRRGRRQRLIRGSTLTEPWLTVVGIGADGLAGLGQRARDALADAAVLVGGSRHLAMLPEDVRPRLAWRSPLADTVPELLALRPRRVVVIATGDPLWYGVGRLLLRHVPAGEVRFLPHISAFQEACSQLGWAMEEVQTLSAHGRSVASLVRHFQPGRRLLVLTDDGATPALIAASLVEQGFGASRTWILEHLSAPAAQIHERSAVTMGSTRYADLNVMAIELALGSGRTALSAIAGIPDECFRS